MFLGFITVDGRPIGTITLDSGDGHPVDVRVQNASFKTDGGSRDRPFSGQDQMPDGGYHPRQGSSGQVSPPPAEPPKNRFGGEGDTDPRPTPQYTGPGGRVHGGFAAARDRARAELKEKPWLNEKAMHVFAGENPDPAASTALWESAINRMAVRGTTLEKELRRTDEGGYYEGWRNEVSPSIRKVLEASRDKALAYSNVSNYATDNASGGRASVDRDSGTFTEKSVYNREHFFGPDNRIAPHQKAYDHLVRESEAGRAQAPALQAAAPGPLSPATGGGRLSGNIDPRVDPRIPEIVGAAATHLPPGYSVEMSSGYRGENTPNHNGRAADFRIIGPDGNAIRNRGEDPDGMYQTLARHAYGEMLVRHPDLKGHFAWGGAFGTQRDGSGERDLMHFDINGERGRYEQYQLRNMGAVPGVEYRPRKRLAEQ